MVAYTTLSKSTRSRSLPLPLLAPFHRNRLKVAVPVGSVSDCVRLASSGWLVPPSHPHQIPLRAPAVPPPVPHVPGEHTTGNPPLEDSPQSGPGPVSKPPLSTWLPQPSDTWAGREGAAAARSSSRMGVISPFRRGPAGFGRPKGMLTPRNGHLGRHGFVDQAGMGAAEPAGTGSSKPRSNRRRASAAVLALENPAISSKVAPTVL